MPYSLWPQRWHVRPPDGKEEASGSPLTSSLPENSMSTLPSALGADRNASCFSAVAPVRGWNQWE